MASASSKPEYQLLGEIMIDITDKVEDLKVSDRNIYRVPCTLRNLNEKAYTPQSISIGPIHYNQEKPNPMQLQKLQYFSYFWARVPDEVAMKKYKGYLASNEEAMRHCYEVKFPHITKEKFVDMMLLDAVFIMELFLRNQAENKSEICKDDSILKQTWLNNSIKRDLLLLENQIPFFILEKLYEYVPDKKHQVFIELAANCFDYFYPYRSNSLPSWLELLKKQKKKWEKKPILHFTDMIRYICLWEDMTQGEKDSSCYRQPTKRKIIKEVRGCCNKINEGTLPKNFLMTAKKLKEAGVSFEKVIHKPLVDIRFKKIAIFSWLLCLGCIPNFTLFKNRLQIPQLKVDDTTECVLRNLIAFEQCHYADQPVICNYVSFIDSLIHTKDDVELLLEKQVIIHELGSDKEVATLVNGLCKQVVTDRTCYKQLIDDLDQHYQSTWNRSMAALRLVYFRDAWRASSTVVGIAVLMFTVYNFCRGLLYPK